MENVIVPKGDIERWHIAMTAAGFNLNTQPQFKTRRGKIYRYVETRE